MKVRMWLAAAAVASSLCVSQVVRAEEYPESAGWGALAVGANLGYVPAKTLYAVLGGLTGGFAYAFTGGDYETASNVWERSLGGTYVLTPSMVRGEDPVVFVGPSSEHPGYASESAGAAHGPDRVEESLPAS
jgi:hypothetical protein